MKIAFILPQNVHDKGIWSGTPYYMYNHLKNSFNEIVTISPIKKGNRLLYFLFTSFSSILNKLTRKQCVNYYHSYFLPKIYAKYIDNILKNDPVDAIVSPSNIPFLYTNSSTPLFIITDATVDLLYKEYNNGKGWSKKYLKSQRHCAITVSDKAVHIVSSSKWIIPSLVNDFNISSSKITVIPFGANLNTDNIKFSIKEIKDNEPVKLLFVGKGWDRKGGAIAIAICDELIKQNVNIQLTIVGSKVPDEFSRPYITNYPMLNKNNPQELSIIDKLYIDAHFFILFPGAEMYGIVFCEAAAYGLPCISNSIGDISEIVINNETGIVLPRDSNYVDYAKQILFLIKNKEKYREMSVLSRKRFETVLNWNAFASKLHETIEKVLNIKS
ncbi:MAG: glycosyltransferase family 4 protein [Bacteroidia bacterium]|nr:glycosyltransferase family 4 protein [Bacteroidia bacterium]